MKERNDEWSFRLACLRENFEYRRLWDRFGTKLRQADNPNLATLAEFCSGLGRIGATWLALDLADNKQEILDLLDPALGMNEVPERLVPRLFPHRPAVRRMLTFGLEHGLFEGITTTAKCPWHMKPEDFGPWQRALLVDMDRPKTQLMAEFEAYVDKFKRDRSRSREEASRHLEVWRLRRKKKSVREIQRTMRLSPDQVIHSYRRAYELTQGRAYDPEEWRKIRDQIHQGDLFKTCGTCPDRKTCTELCPDVMLYADQDEVSLAELLK